MKKKIILFAILSVFAISSNAELRRKTDPDAAISKPAVATKPSVAPAPIVSPSAQTKPPSFDEDYKESDQQLKTPPATPATPVVIKPSVKVLTSAEIAAKAQAKADKAAKLAKSKEDRVSKANEAKALAGLKTMTGCNSPAQYGQIAQFGYSPTKSTPAIDARIKRNCDEYMAASKARTKSYNDQFNALNTKKLAHSQAEKPAAPAPKAENPSDGVSDFFGKLGDSVQKGKAVKECSGAEISMHSNGC